MESTDSVRTRRTTRPLHYSERVESERARSSMLSSATLSRALLLFGRTTNVVATRRQLFNSLLFLRSQSDQRDGSSTHLACELSVSGRVEPALNERLQTYSICPMPAVFETASTRTNRDVRCDVQWKTVSSMFDVWTV